MTTNSTKRKKAWGKAWNDLPKETQDDYNSRAKALRQRALCDLTPEEKEQKIKNIMANMKKQVNCAKLYWFSVEYRQCAEDITDTDGHNGGQLTALQNLILKPIFHCDAKLFALCTGVGLDHLCHTFGSPNAKYTNMLVYFGIT